MLKFKQKNTPSWEIILNKKLLKLTKPQFAFGLELEPNSQFANDFNIFQVEIIPTSIQDLKQDEGELDSVEETLKLYISIAGTWLWLNLAP